MAPKSMERWGDGPAYERYIGRWSRSVAGEFLAWLSVPARKDWADVGCGTGTLVQSILTNCEPNTVIGIDRSDGFLSVARQNVSDARVLFEKSDAVDLRLDSGVYDVTVSGLVLNFVPDHQTMVQEMTRVTKPGGKVAAYVWDYAGRMEIARWFWDAAIAISPHDAKLDQGNRFPICQPEPLQRLFQRADLTAIEVKTIDIQAVFQDFKDYWTPFLGGIGSAPTYLDSIDDEIKEQIRLLLQEQLTTAEDGTITLSARAWAVQGTVKGSCG